MRTVITVDVQPYQNDTPKYWAVSIDEPLSENFVTEQPEKIWLYGATRLEKVLDLTPGTHTIYVGVDTPLEKPWSVQVWINDTSITGGQYLPTYRGNFLEKTFDVTSDAPYLTLGIIVNTFAMNPLTGWCQMIYPWENPQLINTHQCCDIIQTDPPEVRPQKILYNHYQFYLNPNSGEQFTPQCWAWSNNGRFAPSGSRSILWWAYSTTPTVRVRTIVPVPQPSYNWQELCFWPYLLRTIPHYSFLPDEKATILLGHVENDTAPPDQWVYVTDQTYTFTINYAEGCKLPPLSNPKIRISDYLVWPMVPIDPARPGRITYVKAKLQNIGTYGIAWPFIAVKESYSATSIVYNSTLQWTLPISTGVTTELELWVEVTPTIASQGYFTLQAGHFEPPPTTQAHMPPMTPIVDQEIRIPLESPITPASIRSLALSSYPPEIAAKIQSLTLSSYPPEVAAKILSLSLSSYAPPTRPPTPKYSVLTGTVYGLMGKPLSNVEVTLNTAYRAVTGADGTFRIENITPATYTITAKPTKIMDKLLYKPASYEIDLTYPAEYDETINLPLNITNLALTGTAATATATIAYIKVKKKPPAYYY